MVAMALLLMGGAVVNVAVAWGCALQQPRLVDHFGPVTDEGRSLWTSVFGQSVFMAREDYFSVTNSTRPHGRVPAAPTSPDYGSMVFVVEEIRIDRFGLTSIQLVDVARSMPPGLFAMKAGWPMRSVAGELVAGRRPAMSVPERHLLTLGSRRTATGGVHRFDLPYRPISIGFAVNTVFYALLLGLLVVVSIGVRRELRRKRGLCETCAYPVGASPVCTECGATVQTRHLRGD